MTSISGSPFVNRQLASFLGTSEEHADFMGPGHVHAEDESRVANEFSACTDSHGEYRDEFRVRRFDGAYRWVVVHGLPRYGLQAEFAGYAGALTDITERREAAQQLRDANEALASELRERMRSQQDVQALSARLINAQEEERSRLARELHDDLGQQVAAVSIATSNLKRCIPADAKEAAERTGRIQQSLRTLAEGMRRLSHQLHPTVLQHLGLAAALRNYCADLASLTSHPIHFHADGASDGIPPSTALCVYRVAQEALQNWRKHAQTDTVDVRLSRTSEGICLVVADRGIGMQAHSQRGLGLTSMRERARLLNGTVEVAGEPGKGVTITLRIPLQAVAHAQAAPIHPY